MEMIDDKKRYRSVQARIRPTKDSDLEIALNMLPSHIDESDLVREALRLLFFNKRNHYYEQLNFDRENVRPIINDYSGDSTELQRVEISDDDLEKNVDCFLMNV
ncbi:hypothetical protein NV379_01760 [Paenibacillus sp. N1-5-1-14]|uniref:hypothetical protein n=1 Tax=Paenibacillus radicibacter TaxID=2972488 RepID=UPI002159928D|nr:hypothetical protein [Paenibacillus radicibacter]MCR8641371.1 hypothetical protein [Paenibacillus radicibacter]